MLLDTAADAGDLPSQTLPPGPSFAQAFGTDPTARARLWEGLELPERDEEEAGGDDDEQPQDSGEHHAAHVTAYRARKERCGHLARLTRGLMRIHRHLDGSAGSTRMGMGEDWCHHRHLWAGEDELQAWAEATPYAPTEGSPVYPAKGYPSCSLPWWSWPPMMSGDSPHLFMLRVQRAEAEVRAQIAAAGGLDDECGWITRPTMPDLAWFDERQRFHLLPPSQQAAAEKAARKVKKTTQRREQRAREQGKDVTAGRAVRPAVEVSADGAFVTLPLTRGYAARVPAADAPLVEGHRWHVIVPSKGAPYAARDIPRGERRKTRLMMHRVEGLTGPVGIIPPAHNSVLEPVPGLSLNAETRCLS